MILAIAIVLGLLVLKLSFSSGWHWGAGLFLAAVPIVFAIFLGLIGVVIGSLFVGAMYKAGA